MKIGNRSKNVKNDLNDDSALLKKPPVDLVVDFVLVTV